MLTIPQRLPVKRMAIYGSTAMLVGFTSTLVMLREFAPKDSPTGVAVVETINKKSSSSTASGLDAKKADGQSKASVTALPDQSELVVRNGNLPAQQYSRLSTAAPTYTAPAPSNAPAITPIASAPATTASGSVPQQTTTQTSTQQPSSGGSTTTQPSLQETVTSTPSIDLNKVRLP